ncbi:hypothetical protein [Chitinimonas koreensis]|uniref:hypothetical protein n=1 Tax=Chitinimonas koreensis TaxID=356302 RepID=UPI00048D2F9D|nr:hypothetical protein [Chitinimonas koreensis]QNM96405.1 hypothetical protein H9L41_21895 [Chitinimonas koreensis]
MYAIEYFGREVRFRSAGARLPIRSRQGAVSWLPWGLTRQENHVAFPHGAWLDLSVVESPDLYALMPRPVVIAARRFMLTGQDKVEHWFDVEEGQVMRGVLLTWHDEARVYVVAERATGMKGRIASRAPRSVTAPELRANVPKTATAAH